jgi:hypothetical protein
MIYVQDNIILQPGNILAYMDLEKHLLPFLQEAHIKLLGAWRTSVGNQQEVTNLYSSEDMGQWQKDVAALLQKKDFLEVYQKALSMFVNTSRKFMMQTPSSPMK